MCDHARFLSFLVLRSPESHGAHEDGSEASVRGAVRAEPRRRREAGEGDPREFEFRYNIKKTEGAGCSSPSLTLVSYV